MTHEEFVCGYRDGTLALLVDRGRAARLVSSRMLLPLVLLPILGASVALALLGYFYTGIGLFVAGLGLRLLVRATSQGYVLARSLRDAEFFREAVETGVVRPGPQSRASS